MLERERTEGAKVERVLPERAEMAWV